MGLPAKHRKGYVSHKKRWDKQTIVDESKLTTDYALKNKKEIRKVELMVSKLKKIAKQLNMHLEASESTEAQNLIAKLKEKGFITPDSNSLDNILDITLRDVLERRLSNILYKHKLARSANQARQFIVHGHVTVGGKTITSPSYLVSLGEEATVAFRSTSILADENHPERNHEMQGGMKEMEEEIKETPIVTEHAGESDAKEAALDEQEQDEVKE